MLRAQDKKEKRMLLVSVGNMYREACDRGDEALFLNELYLKWFARYPVGTDDPEFNHWAEGEEKRVSDLA